MGHYRREFVAIRILMLLGMFVATPVAASTFDGEWNVQIASANAASGIGPGGPRRRGGSVRGGERCRYAVAREVRQTRHTRARP